MVEWPGGRVVKVTGRGYECHDGPQVDHLGPHMAKINFAHEYFNHNCVENHLP